MKDTMLIQTGITDASSTVNYAKKGELGYNSMIKLDNES